VAPQTRSGVGDVDDGLGEIIWSFLRKVVPNAAFDEPVLVSAGEFLDGSPSARPRRQR
jgi:hypothetical protein